MEDKGLKYRPDGMAQPAVMFPAKRAFIYWNYDGGVCDVTVHDGPLPDRTAPRFSGGAAYSAWCDLQAQTLASGLLGAGDLTPEGLFGKLLALGFKNEDEVRRALVGLAQLEECGWARRALYGYDAEIQPKKEGL